MLVSQKSVNIEIKYSSLLYMASTNFFHPFCPLVANILLHEEAKYKTKLLVEKYFRHCASINICRHGKGTNGLGHLMFCKRWGC